LNRFRCRLPKNLPLRTARTQGQTRRGFGHREHREHKGRIEVRHRFTLIHTAGRELLPEDGGQTMEDGRQKRRLKIKSLSPDFPTECRPYRNAYQPRRTHLSPRPNCGGNTRETRCLGMSVLGCAHALRWPPGALPKMASNLRDSCALKSVRFVYSGTLWTARSKCRGVLERR